MDDERHGVVDGAMLLDRLEGDTAIRAVSSHHFGARRYGTALRHGRYRFFHFALVRQPLARFLSIYKFYRRAKFENAFAKFAKELDIGHFLSLLINNHPYLVDNPQVNIFSNHGFYAHPVSARDSAKARERYEQFALCGTVERYDEGMVTAEYFNSPIYAPTGLDLSYVRQNVSETMDDEGDAELLLGQRNFDWFSMSNQHDEELWRFANWELDRRIARVPDFDARLRRFRERCRALSSVCTARLGLGGGGC